jgi:hypothetical protein
MLAAGRATVRLTGTLVLTDRNVYFQGSRAEVLVIPISTINSSEFCRTTVKTLGMRLGRTSDNGLHIPSCEVRRVPLDMDADLAGGATVLQVCLMTVSRCPSIVA